MNWRLLRRRDLAAGFIVAIIIGGFLFVKIEFADGVADAWNRWLGPGWECTPQARGEPTCIKGRAGS
jgi:hypothetical protein